MFGRYHTPSARPSLFMFGIDRPVARISSSLVLHRAVVLSLWRRDRNRMDSGENDYTQRYRISSFFITIHGVTPLLLSRTSCAAGNGRLWNIHRTHPIRVHQGLILQAFSRFTYVTAHFPTLPFLYLRHSSFSNPSVASPTSQLILQPFFRFSYVTGFSLMSPGEPPMESIRL